MTSVNILTAKGNITFCFEKLDPCVMDEEFHNYKVSWTQGKEDREVTYQVPYPLYLSDIIREGLNVVYKEIDDALDEE